MRFPLAISILAFAGVANAQNLPFLNYAVQPAQPDNPGFEYKITKKCKVSQYGRAWVEANVQKMTWTGSCKKGSMDVDSGTLVVSLKDGSTEQLVGEFIDGVFSSGVYTDRTSVKREGYFRNGVLWRGKIYRPDGRLEFDGNIVDAVYSSGKITLKNGIILDGTFSTDPALMNRVLGFPIKVAILYTRNGRPDRYFITTGEYSSDEFVKRLRTLNATWDAEAADADRKRKLASDSATKVFYAQSEQRRLEAEARERAQQANKPSALEQIVSAVGAAANIVKQGRESGQQGTTAGSSSNDPSSIEALTIYPESAERCVSIRMAEKRVQYQYTEIHNSCGFEVQALYWVYLDGSHNGYNDQGAKLAAGASVTPSSGIGGNITKIEFHHACPTREEMTRRLGKKVAWVGWDDAKHSCRGTLEAPPVGTVK